MGKEAPRAATASDIARHLGLAPTTVSHVLAGRAERVRIKPETQQRVIDAARELGYRPNASARAMRTGKTGCVALVIPLGGEYLPVTLLRGLTRALEQQEMHLAIAQVENATLSEEGYLPKVVRELAADGILVNLSTDVPVHLLDTIRQHRVPTIWINSRLDDDCVHPDDFGAAQTATRHLQQLGHTRIALAVHDPAGHHYSVTDRRLGYEAAMAEAGLPAEVALLAPRFGTADRDGLRIAAYRELLRRPDRPTAILAYEHEFAFPLFIAAAECGLSIPADLSVIMFHDNAEVAIGRAVTTMESQMEHIGEEAARAIVEKIKRPDRPLPACRTVSVLSKGATTAPPR